MITGTVVTFFFTRGLVNGLEREAADARQRLGQTEARAELATQAVTRIYYSDPAIQERFRNDPIVAAWLRGHSQDSPQA